MSTPWIEGVYFPPVLQDGGDKAGIGPAKQQDKGSFYNVPMQADSEAIDAKAMSERGA